MYSHGGLLGFLSQAQFLRFPLTRLCLLFTHKYAESQEKMPYYKSGPQDLKAFSTPITSRCFCDPMINLWCYIEGECNIFNVCVPPYQTVDVLKCAIYNKGSSRSFVGYDPMDLTLTKVLYHDLYVNTNITNGLCWLVTSQVDVKYNEAWEKVKARQYRPTPNDVVLREFDRISELWPKPHDDDLHVVISLPRGVDPAFSGAWFFFSPCTWVI
jgi:hypothetical protein